MEQKEKRNITFDTLKLFGIILVIYGHCCQHLISIPFEQNSYYRFIYSFHMPLFFVISGYFCSHYFDCNCSKVISKKSRELLIPLFTWTIIAIICVETKNIYQHNELFPIYDIIAISIKYFWFIKCLFMAYILLLSLVFYTNKFLGIVLSLVISQFITIYNFNVMFPLFISGIILKQRTSLLKSKILLSISLMVFIIMITHWNSSFWDVPNLYHIKSYIELQIFIFKTIYRILIGLAGSMAFILMFNKIFNLQNNTFYKRLSVNGQFTLGIYLQQTILLEELFPLIVKFNSNHIYIFHFIFAPIFSIVISLMLAKFTRYLCTIKYAGIILFGK